MKYSINSGSALAVVFLLLCSISAAAQNSSPQAKQKVRVLFVQRTVFWDEEPHPSRAADFVQFLEKNFASVKTITDREFTPGEADDVDVIIVDGDIRDKMPPEFHRPMILVGSGFEPLEIARNYDYKTTPACHCLTENLYAVKSDHEIFRSPLTVRPTLTVDVDPQTYRSQLVWKTHEPLESGNFDRYGVVAGGAVLWDAPDSEIIAEGMSSKGILPALALAREANIFHWGPSVSPSMMNDELRRVFVNTIVYMKRFDGAKQTSWREVPPRSKLKYVFNEVLSRKDAKKGLKQWQIDEIKLDFPPNVVKSFGQDVSKYRDLYETNLGYVYVPHGATWFVVDEEAKSLGIPNNSVRMLDECMRLLRDPVEAVKARRLLERYTGLSFPDASRWQRWLDQNRTTLYFSDEYDYKFYPGPAGPSPDRELPWALKEMRMAEPTDGVPVSVGLVAVGYEPEEPIKPFVGDDGKLHFERYTSTQRVFYDSEQGGLVTIVVRLKIAKGWNTIARASANSKYQSTKINLDLPSCARWYGDWHLQKASETNRPGITEQRGDVIYTRQAYFTSFPTQYFSSATRDIRIPIDGSVEYQPCKGARCFGVSLMPINTTVVMRDYNDYYDPDTVQQQTAISTRSTEDPLAVQKAKSELMLDKPNDIEPLSIGAILVSDSRQPDGTYTGKTGNPSTLVVRINIADGWHVYAHVPSDSAYLPTSLSAELPVGACWQGEWNLPASYDSGDLGVSYYSGDAIFSRQIFFENAGKQKVSAVIRYQVCNAEKCLPPKRISLDTFTEIRN